MRDVSSTFALSTDGSRPPRDAGENEGAAGDALDLARVVLAGVEDGAVVAACRAGRSRGRRRARGRSAGRCPRPTPDGGSRRRRARLAARSGPAPGRTRPPSHFGRRPRRAATASAARQAASVSPGSGSPTASIAAPPKACSSISSIERQRAEHAHGLRHHLGPDPVARQADDRARRHAAPAGSGRAHACTGQPGPPRTAARRSRRRAGASIASSRPRSRSGMPCSSL